MWLDYNNVEVSHLFESVNYNDLVCVKNGSEQLVKKKLFEKSQIFPSVTQLTRWLDCSCSLVIYGLKDCLIFEETFPPRLHLNCFQIYYILKCNLISVMAKLNFQHHYSSLQ